MRSAPSLVSGVVHGFLLAAAFAFVARPLALEAGLVSGMVGALVGAVTATLLARARVRLLAAWAVALAIGGVSAGAAALLVGHPVFASALGLGPTLELAEAVRVGGGVWAFVLATRSGALRWRGFLALEALLVAAAVTVPVAAHRDGMIARPLEIADWFWSRGLDPALAFVGIGLFGVLVVSGMFSKGRNPARTTAQLLVVLLLAGSLASFLYGSNALPSLREPSGGASSGEGDGKGGEGGSSAEPPPSAGASNDDPGPGQERWPMAVVVFHKDNRPLWGLYYFRDAAYSQFNGTRLVEAVGGEADADIHWRFPARTVELTAPPPSPARTRVATDVALIADHRRAFALSSAVELSPLVNPSPARFRRAYRAVSSLVVDDERSLLGHAPGNPEWSTELWHHYTELPNDPRYIELAREATKTLQDAYVEDPFAQAIAVRTLLEKSTIYTFDVRYEGADPTGDFLFTEADRRGYCVHIAHSAAMLLRALGVPTRVGSGYAVDANNLGGGSALLVQSSDAHAWVEIYLEDVGWVPIEIVPERTEVEPPAFQEDDLQQLLGEMARAEGKETYELPTHTPLLEWLKAALRVLPWVLLSALALAYLWRLLRWTRPLVAPEQVAASYRAALDRLASVGLVRRPGESRERFALRVAPHAPSFPALTELFVSSVLGASKPEGRARGGARAGALAARVGRELRRSLPVWRTGLGMLHPAPWWWSK